MQTPWQEDLIEPSLHTFGEAAPAWAQRIVARASWAIAASGLDDERILHLAAQLAPDALGLQEYWMSSMPFFRPMPLAL